MMPLMVWATVICLLASFRPCHSQCNEQRPCILVIFCLLIKNGVREVHPLAALYPTVRLYPTGDRSGEISYSKVATPGTT